MYALLHEYFSMNHFHLYSRHINMKSLSISVARFVPAFIHVALYPQQIGGSLCRHCGGCDYTVHVRLPGKSAARRRLKSCFVWNT